MLLPTDYDFVFWIRESLDGVLLTLKINHFLENYGTDYMPVYLADKEIDLEPDKLKTAFAAWMDSSGLLLATGLKSKNGLVLRMTIDSHQYPNISFPNTLRLGFNQEHLNGNHPALKFEDLLEIFKFGVDLLSPFYAFGGLNGEINISREYKIRYKTVDLMKLPVAIEWFNYFGPDMTSRLGGTDFLLTSPVYLSEFNNRLGGVFLILQREPFDFKDPEHLRRRRSVEDYFSLDSLQKQHLRS